VCARLDRRCHAQETGRFIYTGMPVSIVAPTDVDPHHFESQHTDSKSQWILTLCRDRDEFPNLQWKMLVAESRRDLHLMFQMHGCTGTCRASFASRWVACSASRAAPRVQRLACSASRAAPRVQRC
jgi:hypothetical protein